MKYVIEKMADKLKEYQIKLQIDENDFVDDYKPGEVNDRRIETYHHLIGGHLLYPLLREYDRHIKVQDNQIKNLSTGLRDAEEN